MLNFLKSREKLRKTFEQLSIFSLFLDDGIAILTLAANTHLKDWSFSFTITIDTLQKIVSWGITAIVVISLPMIVMLAYLRLTENAKS